MVFLSEFLPVKKGAPQGFVLVPLLFSLFINDLCAVVTSMYHVYADDFQIYAGDTVDNLARCVEPLNADLRRIHQWSLENELRDESQLVHPLPVLSLDRNVMPYSRN
jgi:hypothetical protein